MGYYKMTMLEESLHIKGIFSFHFFEYVKNFSGKEENHDFWEFVYVDYGRIQVFSDEDSVFLSAGEAFLHKPNELHNIFSMEEYASVIIFSFAAECEKIECLCKKALKIYGEEKYVLEQFFQCGSRAFEEPWDIFEQPQVKLAQQMPYGMQQVTLRYLEILLLKLIQKETEGNTGIKQVKDGEIETNMDKVVKILQKHLFDKLSMEDVSRESGYSKSYLAKLFKNMANMGVMDYYNQMKIKEAKRMISEGKNSFAEIAEKLNYSSVHYFSRCFKKSTNMTPSGYKISVKRKMTI